MNSPLYLHCHLPPALQRSAQECTNNSTLVQWQLSYMYTCSHLAPFCEEATGLETLYAYSKRYVCPDHTQLYPTTKPCTRSTIQHILYAVYRIEVQQLASKHKNFLTTLPSFATTTQLLLL